MLYCALFCRYGWIQGGLIAIPRVFALPHCANSATGVYTIQKPSSNTFDVFCFNATEYENCSPEISSPTLSLAELNVTGISQVLSALGKHIPSSLQTTKAVEHPMARPAESHDVVTIGTVAAESELLTLTPRPDESLPQSSSRSHIQSSVSPSRKSGAAKKQATRAVTGVTANYTVELGMSPTVPGYITNNLPETMSPSLQKNASMPVNGSEHVGDMTLYDESNRQISLKTENQVTENKLQHHSETELTGIDTITHSSSSALISDNLLEVNVTMNHTEVHKDASDFQPTLEELSVLRMNTENGHEQMVGVTSTQSSETTQKPSMFGIQRAGTAPIPMTPNPTELPKETMPGTRMSRSELMVNNRADAEEPFTASPSLTYLPAETGSASEIVSSESVKVHLDRMTVAAFNAKLIPSTALPSDPRENGSALEVLTSEPIKTIRENSTVLGGHRRFSLPASVDPAVLFTKSGSPPVIQRSDAPPPALRFSLNFTVTTGIARLSTGQPASPDSKRERHPAALGNVSQDIQVKPTPSVSPSDYLPTATTSSSTKPDRPTSPFLQSLEMTLTNAPINNNEKREMELAPPSSKESTGQLKLPHTTRTHDFGQTAPSHTMTNSITKAKPNSTMSDHVILDDGFGLKLQTPPSVGDKPPETNLDWLIVVAIIGSLLIIIFGGLLTAYSKRLCGRKKSLAITRPQDDNAAIMKNGNGRDLVDESGLKADIQRSDEWIQLMSKDNVEVVSESAEATRLMSGKESGEPSHREIVTTTADEEDRS
ncbi:uncharacterized protein LOC109923897 [Rhincodon typus]|uniref:uncharacterized protein LOC109923897 n=1 Tax=Rhincodon typus TaxID=259920 RepID=UPI00202DDFF4|nr:uncharacterized protein LOC109923897 [Rhincodon typus]